MIIIYLVCFSFSEPPQSRHTSSDLMPRINSNVSQQWLSQNDGRYDLKSAIGELVVYDKGIPSQDKCNRHTGHVVGITSQQYYIKLVKGPLIRRKQSNCTNRIRGYDKSLHRKEFPKSHPAPTVIALQKPSKTASFISTLPNISSIRIQKTRRTQQLHLTGKPGASPRVTTNSQLCMIA